MSADFFLALMVALIFCSGLLFAAHLRIDAGRARARAPDTGGARRASAVVIGLALLVGAVFLAAAGSVVLSLVGG